MKYIYLITTERKKEIRNACTCTHQTNHVIYNPFDKKIR